MNDLLSLSLCELSQKLESGQTTSLEATEACFSQIESHDKEVHAFVRLTKNQAMLEAKRSDERRANGKALGPLDGIPLALKDMILTEGVETNAGSAILEKFVPPYDATVVKLLKGAGAVFLGKLNQDEFAMGSSTQTSNFGATHNPYKLSCTAGGSSGGSAAAVASRMCFGALGTDTGGSIRQPASLTNTVGLKPTYGRVSRYGIVAYASSLDQVGPMTKTVEDAAMLLDVLAVHDSNDSTCMKEAPKDSYRKNIDRGVKGLKLGVPKEYFASGLNQEVESRVREAIALYEKLGATVVEISLPHTQYALATYYLIAPAEASSNLARYDGVRYGRRVDSGKGLKEMYVDTRTQGFGEEVKRRIMLGTFALSAGYYDAYYLNAQKVRTLIKNDFDEAFKKVDAIVAPTSPVPAFELKGKIDDPLAMYLMDVLTIPCNLAGLPGISIPCGFTKENLPIGLQLLGSPFQESQLFQIAKAYERETRFYARAPTFAV